MNGDRVGADGRKSDKAVCLLSAGLSGIRTAARLGRWLSSAEGNEKLASLISLYRHRRSCAQRLSVRHCGVYSLYGRQICIYSATFCSDWPLCAVIDTKLTV